MFRGRPDADEVLPGLLLGSAPGPSHISRLARREGVTRVLDLREPDEGPLSIWPGQVEVRRHPIPDRACPGAESLAELAAWLRVQLGEEQRVLVHCLAGQGRAPTVVVALLVSMGYPVSQAHRLVKERRPGSCPTDAQLQGLIDFERRLRPPLAPEPG